MSFSNYSFGPSSTAFGARLTTVALLSIFLSAGVPVSASDAPGTPDSLQSAFHYALVGIAQFDGVSYASLVDRQSKEHLLLSTENSEEGLTLAAITGDDASSGPSAIIQKDGISVRLELESGDFLNQPNTSSGSPPPITLIPMPGSEGAVSSAAPKPPPGATLPLVFQAVDPQKLNLTDEQQKTLNQLRADFAAAVNGNGSNANTATTTPDTTSASSDTQSAADAAQQLKNWRLAQQQSNDLFKMQFGWQAFNSYEIALAPSAAP